MRIKSLPSLFLYAWFFGFQYPVSPTATATTKVGPFATEAECKAELSEAVESLGGFPRIKFLKCVEERNV